MTAGAAPPDPATATAAPTTEGGTRTEGAQAAPEQSPVAEQRVHLYEAVSARRDQVLDSFASQRAEILKTVADQRAAAVAPIAAVQARRSAPTAPAP